jgi:NAD+ synthase (glutamine-hydrolysing)
MNSRITVAQIDVRVGDLDYNLKRHIECAEEARSENSRIIIFPELSLTGYSIRDLVHELAHPSYSKHPGFQELLKISRDIRIIAGGVEEAQNFGLHNAVFYFADGELQIVHRKIYLPTYGMFEEGRYFLPGHSVHAFETGFGRWGALVCEDLWHISLPYLLAQDGADVIIGLSASPTRLGGDKNEEPAVAGVNMEHHKTYARLLSCYIVFCNRVGFEDGIGFWGGSTIIAPTGTIVKQAPFFEEAIIHAEISKDDIKRARRDSRHALDERPEFVLKELERMYRS